MHTHTMVGKTRMDKAVLLEVRYCKLTKDSMMQGMSGGACMGQAIDGQKQSSSAKIINQ